MIFSMKGNMYEINLAETWELFGTHAHGSQQALVCVVSRQPLEQDAQQALNSSTEQFGYGKNACTFLSLLPAAKSSENASELDAAALFLAVEGFDPICLVATDAFAARALQEAYRCEVRTQSVNRLFGRTAVAFVDFPRMLKSAQDKQRAWALLKQLPRFGNVQ